MDFKDTENKDLLIEKISVLSEEYKDFLIALANSDSTLDYKKSALLYYWLKEYKNYLQRENIFDSNYCPEFYRGSIVSVSLGFNLGAEMGGLHYAIVLRDSNRKNPNLVIMPLSSLKPNTNIAKLRPSEIFLGDEIFSMVQAKYKALKTSIPTELSLLKQLAGTSPKDNSILSRIEELEKKVLLLDKTIKKLAVLKHGSIAVANQITTISKMRVKDPTNKYDILYGLKLSASKINLIDQVIVNLYTSVR